MNTKSNTLIVPITKPRNYLVALTRSRKAGSHGANRRQARRDNRRLES